MRKGINAAIVDNEYRRKKVYEKKHREKCIDQDCTNCKYSKICIEGECGDEKKVD